MLAAPLSGVLAYFPLIGAVVAFCAVIKVWHWHWYSAVALFGVQIWLPLVLAAADAVLKKINPNIELGNLIDW